VYLDRVTRIDMPDEIIEMLVALTDDVFREMVLALDTTGEYTFPDDVFLDAIQDIAVDTVVAPLFGVKMGDGMSSPLQNKVWDVMLYLPEDKFSYLED
jgi:hypothetical protein